MNSGDPDQSRANSASTARAPSPPPVAEEQAHHSPAQSHTPSTGGLSSSYSHDGRTTALLEINDRVNRMPPLALSNPDQIALWNAYTLKYPAVGSAWQDYVGFMDLNDIDLLADDPRGLHRFMEWMCAANPVTYLDAAKFTHLFTFRIKSAVAMSVLSPSLSASSSLGLDRSESSHAHGPAARPAPTRDHHEQQDTQGAPGHSRDDGASAKAHDKARLCSTDAARQLYSQPKEKTNGPRSLSALSVHSHPASQEREKLPPLSIGVSRISGRLDSPGASHAFSPTSFGNVSATGICPTLDLMTIHSESRKGLARLSGFRDIDERYTERDPKYLACCIYDREQFPEVNGELVERLETLTSVTLNQGPGDGRLKHMLDDIEVGQMPFNPAKEDPRRFGARILTLIASQPKFPRNAIAAGQLLLRLLPMETRNQLAKFVTVKYFGNLLLVLDLNEYDAELLNARLDDIVLPALKRRRDFKEFRYLEALHTLYRHAAEALDEHWGSPDSTKLRSVELVEIILRKLPPPVSERLRRRIATKPGGLGRDFKIPLSHLGGAIKDFESVIDFWLVNPDLPLLVTPSPVSQQLGTVNTAPPAQYQFAAFGSAPSTRAPAVSTVAHTAVSLAGSREPLSLQEVPADCRQWVDTMSVAFGRQKRQGCFYCGNHDHRFRACSQLTVDLEDGLVMWHANEEGNKRLFTGPKVNKGKEPVLLSTSEFPIRARVERRQQGNASVGTSAVEMIDTNGTAISFPMASLNALVQDGANMATMEEYIDIDDDEHFLALPQSAPTPPSAAGSTFRRVEVALARAAAEPPRAASATVTRPTASTSDTSSTLLPSAPVQANSHQSLPSRPRSAAARRQTAGNAARPVSSHYNGKGYSTRQPDHDRRRYNDRNRSCDRNERRSRSRDRRRSRSRSRSHGRPSKRSRSSRTPDSTAVRVKELSDKLAAAEGKVQSLQKELSLEKEHVKKLEGMIVGYNKQVSSLNQALAWRPAPTVPGQSPRAVEDAPIKSVLANEDRLHFEDKLWGEVRSVNRKVLAQVGLKISSSVVTRLTQNGIVLARQGKSAAAEKKNGKELVKDGHFVLMGDDVKRLVTTFASKVASILMESALALSTKPSSRMLAALGAVESNMISCLTVGPPSRKRLRGMVDGDSRKARKIVDKQLSHNAALRVALKALLGTIGVEGMTGLDIIRLANLRNIFHRLAMMSDKEIAQVMRRLGFSTDSIQRVFPTISPNDLDLPVVDRPKFTRPGLPSGGVGTQAVPPPMAPILPSNQDPLRATPSPTSSLQQLLGVAPQPGDDMIVAMAGATDHEMPLAELIERAEDILDSFDHDFENCLAFAAGHEPATTLTIALVSAIERGPDVVSSLLAEISNDADPTVAKPFGGRVRMTTRTITVPISLGGTALDALIDNGSQACLADKDTVELAGRKVSPLPGGPKYIKVANGAVAKLCGVLVERIKLLGVESWVLFFVMEGLAKPLILGINALLDLGIATVPTDGGFLLRSAVAEEFFPEDSQFAEIGGNEQVVLSALTADLFEDESVLPDEYLQALGAGEAQADF